jgi:hypothetical protein
MSESHKCLLKLSTSKLMLENSSAFLFLYTRSLARENRGRQFCCMNVAIKKLPLEARLNFSDDVAF